MLRTSLHSMLASIIACGILISIPLTHILATLPDISEPEALLATQSIIIADRTGQELYRFYQEEDRTSLAADAISPHMVNAIVAIEDKRFFTRSSCIDLRALGRALRANFTDYKSQGASTITQQLVRTAFLTREKTIDRKLREIILACKLEQHRTKEDILSLYVNWIGFGHGIAGVGQASKRYFGVDAADLTIAQSALLAALPQRPSYFSPYGPQRHTTLSKETLQGIYETKDITSQTQIHQEDIRIGLLEKQIRIGGEVVSFPGRTNVVLKAMRDQGYISKEEWSSATEELSNIDILERRDPISAPHFVLGIREVIEDQINAREELELEDGIIVETTLDPLLQKLAEEVIAKEHQRVKQNFGAHNLSLIALDPRSGELLAYIGNSSFFDTEHSGQMDIARRPRQTGSAFKPFVYAMLMEQGYTPESRIYDTPLNPKTYQPFSRGFYGRMNIRSALGRSRNTPAVRAFYAAGGEDAVLSFAEQIGITSPKIRKEIARKYDPKFKYAWSLVLGAGEASLLEMVEGYGMLAHGGIHQSLIGIRAISNRNGALLYAPTQTRKRVISQKSADAITDILRDETAREPLWRTAMHLPGTALKTGTGNICTKRRESRCRELLTNNTWTFGYTDDLVVGVWVGNADNTPLTGEANALEVAVPVWKAFMKQALVSRSP